MKFTLVTLLALAASAFAAPSIKDRNGTFGLLGVVQRAWARSRAVEDQPVRGRTARDKGLTACLATEIYARQANVVGPNQVPVAQAAMTNRNGDVIPFNARGVYLDSKVRGL